MNAVDCTTHTHSPPSIDDLHAEGIDTAPLWIAAQLYAAAGVPIFPLRPGDKRPATRDGFKAATTCLVQVSAWWAQCEDYNVGMPTGIIADVVDLDSPDAAEAIFSGEAWETGLLGHVQTPREGGHHLYYPPNPNARNGVALRPGIDVRATGGYVVLPPSRLNPDLSPKSKHWSATPYAWARPLQIGGTSP